MKAYLNSGVVSLDLFQNYGRWGIKSCSYKVVELLSFNLFLLFYLRIVVDSVYLHATNAVNSCFISFFFSFSWRAHGVL